MSRNHIPGNGRKRSQLHIPITKLHLDSENPRLPEEALGKSESEVLSVLYTDFNLDELAESMAKNGYFDEEPLVAFPSNLPKSLKVVNPNEPKFINFIKSKDTEFIVAEGNRRLATARLLLDYSLREKLHIKHWPKISRKVEDDLQVLPAIVYPTRSEVLPYLGVRHIIGIQKWDSYAKARYIAKMVDGGKDIKEIQEQIGDKQGSTRRSYLGYKLLEQVEDEFDLDTMKAKNNFSLLLLAVGQGNIKRFLGLPIRLSDVDLQYPVPKKKLKNLKDLLSWIYGDGNEEAVIKESRDITSYLSHVVSSPEAVSYLERTRKLTEAYDRTDGEEKMLIRYLTTANSKLEAALGIAHRHKTLDVISEIEKCEKTIFRLLKTVKEPND